jgi:pimeloyl-ACP methyl ester carboxylesterase
MKHATKWSLYLPALAVVIATTLAPAHGSPVAGATQATTAGHASEAKITRHDAVVNGVKIHYMEAGSGPVIVLLHGYAETSHMWLPLIPLLARNHTVIAPDLRGEGDSGKPQGGYEKKNMATDIHALVQSLGYKHVQVVGHDIGLMVAYAYAAMYPSETDSVVLMDAFLPGIGDWKTVWLAPSLWHFHFFDETARKLVKGRERTYLDHFWNGFAADPKHAISEADKALYTKAYSQPGAMAAGFEYFKAFPQDARDFEALSAHKLAMPMLVLSGEKAGGMFLIDQAKLAATDVDGVVIKGSGHWLMEEAPGQVMPLLTNFLNKSTR